jgi:hypothetical protein
MEEVARTTFEKTGDEISACAAAKIHEISLRKANVLALQNAAKQTADQCEKDVDELVKTRQEPAGMTIFMKDYYIKLGKVTNEVYVLKNAKKFLASLDQDTKEVQDKINNLCDRINATITLIQPKFVPAESFTYKDLYPTAIQIIRTSIIHQKKLACFSKKINIKNFNLIADEIDLRFQKASKILEE